MAQEVAEASTTEPNTGACRSPTTSSSANSTAASGVLNAAATAAAAPTGMSALIFSGLSPSQRPSSDAMPAPTCTEGPSVQVGAGIASLLGRWLGLSPEKIKALIPVGAAAAGAQAVNNPPPARPFVPEEVGGGPHA